MTTVNRIVVLGALGDLATRLLIPSMSELIDAGYLDNPPEVVGVARAELSTDDYRGQMRENLQSFSPETGNDARERLLEALSYVQADATDASALDGAIGDDPAAIYLALPPAIYAGAIDALERLDLPEGSRIIIEKPFGDDLDSSIKLNKQLRRVFPETAIYRIDHFTALQAVEAIPAIRFGNPFIERAWNAVHIERVEIIWDDTLALEGRAGYYDSAGALRDMLQNHLLQVMCVLAMEAPASLSGDDLRARKLDVLKVIRKQPVGEAADRSYRARYTSGVIDGEHVPGYAEEDGVDPKNEIETFAEIELDIEHPRWTGVPFLLRSGKAQREDRRFVNVVFRETGETPFDDARESVSNALRIELLPDRPALSLVLSQPERPTSLRPVELSIDLPEERVQAHGVLLYDILRGDQSRFVLAEEAEESWRVVQPFLDAWSQNLTPLREYPAGTIVETGTSPEQSGAG